MVRIAVTGTQGQLARSLLEAAAQSEGADVIAVGRPELDLTHAQSVAKALAQLEPDIMVNVAAYTAVDKAESEPELAFSVNGMGAGNVAEACSRLGIPLLHVSTDYVFAGTKPTAYLESDRTGPVTVYGQSKLAGEMRVQRACAQHLILRTAWLHSPFGHNFVKTMLRLAAERSEISVVNDQFGCPTYAPHLAVAIIEIARQIVVGQTLSPWGVFHAAGSGRASWHDLASETFRVSRELGGPWAKVTTVPTSAYPTLAKRPENSCLDGSKLRQTFDVRLPEWPEGVAACVARLLSSD